MISEFWTYKSLSKSNVVYYTTNVNSPEIPILMKAIKNSLELNPIIKESINEAMNPTLKKTCI